MFPSLSYKLYTSCTATKRTIKCNSLYKFHLKPTLESGNSVKYYDNKCTWQFGRLKRLKHEVTLWLKRFRYRGAGMVLRRGIHGYRVTLYFTVTPILPWHCILLWHCITLWHCILPWHCITPRRFFPATRFIPRVYKTQIDGL